MARPQKTGLDYFPLNVDIELDEKFEYISSRFGAAGYATFISILCAIYRNGYYINWTETHAYILSKRVSVDKNTCSEIVSECINVGLFDKNLYENYGILTSHGVQTRYLQASERRASVQIVKEYTLLSRQEMPKKGRISLISCCKEVSVDRNTDSKEVSVAETERERNKTSTKIPKVKESKVYIGGGGDAREGDESDGEIDSNFGEVMTAFSNNIHPVTGEIEMNKLAELLSHYGKGWVLAAINEAAELNGRSVRYIETVLTNWERNGFKSKMKGERNNGRTGRTSQPYRKTEGIRKLEEDMRYADEHAVDPWDVPAQQRDAGGTSAGNC